MVGDGLFLPVPEGDLQIAVCPDRFLDKAWAIFIESSTRCGRNSVVECNLAKVEVASSNLVARSKKKIKGLRRKTVTPFLPLVLFYHNAYHTRTVSTRTPTVPGSGSASRQAGRTVPGKKNSSGGDGFTGQGRKRHGSAKKMLPSRDRFRVICFSLRFHYFPKGVNPMKKVLSVICALFVTVAFACVTLAADKPVKAAPADNTAKTAPADNTAKTPKKK